MSEIIDIYPGDHLLVAWSGGLDSTYLIWKAIQLGIKVDAAYFELVNNATKVKREQMAIGALLPYFNQNPNFKFLGTTVKFEIGNDHEVVGSYLQQVPIWLSSIVYSYNEKHNKIALGYVTGDDDISYLPEIQGIYAAVSKMFRTDKIPELVIPLRKISKWVELQELPHDIINSVTFCEEVLADGEDNCGKCAPCRWWKYLEEAQQVPWQCYRFHPREEPTLPEIELPSDKPEQDVEKYDTMVPNV